MCGARAMPRLAATGGQAKMYGAALFGLAFAAWHLWGPSPCGVPARERLLLCQGPGLSRRKSLVAVRATSGVPQQDYQVLFGAGKVENLQDLRQKWALVTGASSGIGKATACALAGCGCNVVLLARRKEKLEAIKVEIGRYAPDVEARVVAGDVNADGTAAELRSAGCLDGLDFLVSNAGLARGKAFVGEAPKEDWKEMLDTNCYGAFQVVNLVLPGMLQRGSGHIVLLGSIAGLEPYEGGAVYAATKHAVHGFARALRYETYSKNIRCTLVAPGFVGEGTEFSEVRFRGDQEKASAVYANMQELRASDIASQIVWALRQPAHVCVDMINVMPTCQGGMGPM